MNVAVIEPKWDGHHPTYFREYALALAELGCRVCAFCPKPEDETLRPLSEGVQSRSITLHQWAPPRVSIRPRRCDPRINWWLAFQWLKKRLRQIESRDHAKFDLLFFACLYDGDLQYFPRSLPWKWAGLYIHVRAFRKPGTPVPYSTLVPDPQRWFRRPDLAGLALLDEGAVEFMRTETGCPNIVPFPDFTDEVSPAYDGVSTRLKAFASGRPIVGMAGHLHPTKGVCVFAKVAEQMKSENVVFALVGEVMSGLFSEEDHVLLQRVLALPNVFSHLKRLPDAASFNGVVSCFDVFFAAYLNFPNSSNTLAKAALFRRPIVVSEGYLMAERVRRYRLGATVPENDVSAATAAIRRLLHDDDHYEVLSDASGYLADHSVTKLRSAFSKLTKFAASSYKSNNAEPPC
jgi:glycosyltransferase involved in cell wall biosynthesis